MFSILRKASFLAAALALSACGTVAASNPSLPELIQNDLAAALTSAQTHNDQPAALCWQELLARAEQPRPTLDVKGAFSAYQEARNLRRGLATMADDKLRMACAPMVIESGEVILRLGTLVK